MTRLANSGYADVESFLDGNLSGFSRYVCQNVGAELLELNSEHIAGICVKLWKIRSVINLSNPT